MELIPQILKRGFLRINNKETIFKGKVNDLEGRKFSELSIMVIDQVKRQTYLEFD